MAHNAVPDSKIESINFTKGSLDLRIIAPSAASFEALGQQLRAATWEADIKEIGASGESYRGRMQIRKAGA
jgi:type II secretory pathway component PulL